jgi:hypothetical protein
MLCREDSHQVHIDTMQPQKARRNFAEREVFDDACHHLVLSLPGLDSRKATIFQKYTPTYPKNIARKARR